MNFIVPRALWPYNEYMVSRQPRNIWWLIVAMCGLSALAWFVNTYSPNSWQFLFVFFSLVCFTSLFFLFYLLNNVRRSVLVSLGIILYLLLRYLNLRESIYLILLLTSLISLEVFLKKR